MYENIMSKNPIFYGIHKRVTPKYPSLLLVTIFHSIPQKYLLASKYPQIHKQTSSGWTQCKSLLFNTIMLPKIFIRCRHNMANEKR